MYVTTETAKKAGYYQYGSRLYVTNL